MLATIADPSDQKGWLYEIKWDGYRAIAFMDKNRTSLLSRNHTSFNEKYYPVYNAIKEWRIQAVVDGEIVATDKNGKPDFGALQNWRSEIDGQLNYYVFDLMWFNGYDLTGVPLKERHKLLSQLIPEGASIIRLSETFDSSASELLKAVSKMGMEGIMAKKEESLYYQGTRTRQWLKMKSGIRHEVVIGGFTRNPDSGKPFSSLLVGVFKKRKLQYTGKIGTGFSIRLQEDLIRRFKPFIRKTNPFSDNIDVNKRSRFQSEPQNASVTWVKPELVCEVSYAEVTTDGVMRHPSFKGMREDKKAFDVHEDIVLPLRKKARPNRLSNKVMLTKFPSGNSLLNPAEVTQSKKINGHELKFTHLDKLFWPKEKITKRDLLNYYDQLAPYILPYLKHRPQSLNRHPDGYSGESFYQKDVTGKVPDWVTLFPYRSADEDIDKNFLVAGDKASLLFMANLGCIEMNPWNSTIQKPDHPTWCVLDLDPDKNEFDSIIQTAQVAHDILRTGGIDSYCKTSGSTGLHIYIPLNSKYTYEQSKEFAHLLATLIQKELPQITTIERTVSKRKGKIYLDFLQNRPQATLASPYSVRPKPGATVSMPLHWDEVKKGLKMTDFTMKNVIPLLHERGDIFKGVLGKGIDMKAALKRLEG